TARGVLNALFGALDSYSGRDPFSLLMVETYLAASRDATLRDQLSAVLVEFRDELSTVLCDRHVPEPDETAGVLAAAIDGIVLHRALGVPLPSSTITRVLARTLHEEGNHR